MHCITLRTLAAQLLLSLPFAHADPTTTTTLTSTTIVRTEWIVITSASNTVTTFTTATFVAGSTIGITTVDGSQPLATPTPAATGSISMAWQGQSFQDAVLNSTNYYRAQHQASPLQWDDSLASYAQDYAKKCVFEHSVRSRLSFHLTPNQLIVAERPTRREPRRELRHARNSHRRLGQRRKGLQLQEGKVLRSCRSLHPAGLEEHDLRRLRRSQLHQ